MVLGSFYSEDKLGRRLIVILQGQPCSWGRCVFCPFQEEQGTLLEVIKNNRRILAEAEEIAREKRVERISVFNGGSFFELPVDTLVRLRKLCAGKVVDVESRPEFVDFDSVVGALQSLGASQLVVRVGFECFDERLRNKLLNKGIPQSEVYRLAELRRELRKRGYPIKFIVYVLFGIEGLPEEKVVESVREFNKLFDGVIAIRYKRFKPEHPREVEVSSELKKFLEENTLLVSWEGP